MIARSAKTSNYNRIPGAGTASGTGEELSASTDSLERRDLRDFCNHATQLCGLIHTFQNVLLENERKIERRKINEDRAKRDPSLLGVWGVCGLGWGRV